VGGRCTAGGRQASASSRYFSLLAVFRGRRVVCLHTAGEMVRLLPPPVAHAAPGRAVRLTLVAPYFEQVLLPTLAGRLAGALPGYFGVLRYLVELDEPLQPGFDPLGELPWFARGRRLGHVVVTPAPEAPTLQTPPDLIGESLARGRTVYVFVSVPPVSRALRAGRLGGAGVSRCPFLCMADLDAVSEAGSEHTTPV
jgi:hypothetical protein